MKRDPGSRGSERASGDLRSEPLAGRAAWEEGPPDGRTREETHRREHTEAPDPRLGSTDPVGAGASRA